MRVPNTGFRPRGANCRLTVRFVFRYNERVGGCLFLHGLEG